VFFAIFGREAHIKSIVSKWLEIDKDNLQTGTAKAVARLMNFAQITCFVCKRTASRSSLVVNQPLQPQGPHTVLGFAGQTHN